MALSVKSWTQNAQANQNGITATIPASPAPASGDVVIVMIGINPRTSDAIAGPAGWVELHTAFFGDGFAVGKVFGRAWVSGLANPAFTWNTRCQAGYKTEVISGAGGVLPSSCSSRVIPNSGPAPAPSIVGTNVITVANIDATNAIEITCAYPPPTGTSQTTERVHGTAG